MTYEVLERDSVRAELNKAFYAGVSSANEIVSLREQPGPLSPDDLKRLGFVVGIHKSADGYRDDPCKIPSLNQSIAHVLVAQSPAHAWQQHPRFGGRRRAPSAAMNEGSLVDLMVFGGEANYVVVDAENYRTKKAQTERDEARGNGLIPVLAHELAEAEERAAFIKARIELAGLDLTAGRNQVPVYWVEYAEDWTPVQCRGLLDQLDGLTIRDLKKAKSANPRDVGRSVERYGYDIQAAAYISGVERCIPDAIGRVDFEWAFVEASEPHAILRATPAGSMLELGRARWRRAVNIWARCLRTGLWPSYEEQGLVRIEASPWALQDMLEAESEEGFNDGKAA